MAKKDLWDAERELYERIYYAITGRHTKVISIPMGADDLGYTSSDETIHLARRHPLMNGLSDEEKQFFRMGVFAHEMAHQLFTDFAYFEKVLNNITWKAERSIVSLFVNLIEDPAIEFSSDREMDGDLLNALRFSIEHIYRKSPKELGDKPFTQLCNALIQFGDMGVLRGNFTSEEAYKFFKQIAPEFNKAVTDPVSKHRIDFAVKWAKLTRPLWETKTEDEDEELMNQIDDIKKSNGISGTSGPKQPKNQNDDDEDDDSKDMDENNAEKQKRRDELIDKMNRNDNKEKDGEKSTSKESSEGERDSNAFDGNDENSEENSSSDSTNKNENSEDDSSDNDSNASSENDSTQKSAKPGSDKTEKDSDESDEEGSPSSKNEKGKEDQKDDSNGQKNESKHNQENRSSTQPSDYGKGQIPDLTGSGIETKERRIDKSVLQGIQNTLKRNAEKKAKERKRDDIHLNLDDAKYGKYGDVKCLNEVIRIEKGNENAFRAEYTRIMKERGKDIRLLTSSLKQIFQQDNTENIRSLSGKYNVVRASKQSTAKIFDKRREAGNLKDLAVFLLIDESGSMRGEKEQIARESAVVLAETFAALKIPCYIMGFTTGQRYHAVHHHYVSWNNTPNERIALAGVHAEAANFDGYSIRNATSILRKRAAEHKILFILSDGYPACSKYTTLEEGIADTTNAIIEAKKTATVLGIGIGDCMPEILKHMYQGAFVHTETINTLSTLTNNLKTILKRKVRN